MMDLDDAGKSFREFVAVIRELRTPGTGCPWDLEQDHDSLRPYLIEEAYEVLDAIDGGDDRALREELGDLLLQVALHAQVADDRGAFCITEVVRGIAEKMVRRHPHVFGSVRVSGSAEVLRNWEQIKAAEAQEKGGKGARAGALADVPLALPALLRAQRVEEKATRAGSARPSVPEVLGEVRAALDDLERQATAGAEPVRTAHGLGDVLFGLCRLAGQLGVSAEDSLRTRVASFVERLGNGEPAGEGEPG